MNPGVDSPSMKHQFQHNKNKHINNETTSGRSDQCDASQDKDKGCSIWTDTASGWSDKGDVSQHRCGSIWTDDQSRSSHTSTGGSTGTNSYTGTDSSKGTHPFAPVASSTATSEISHHHDDPLLVNLAGLLLGGGHDSSQQVGSGSTGGTAISQSSSIPKQQHSSRNPSTLERDGSSQPTAGKATSRTAKSYPINSQSPDADGYHKYKEMKWLNRMNRNLAKTPVGELDPAKIPLPGVMYTWAKVKSSHGASMVEMWLKRAQQEYDVGNHRVVPTAEMYAMAGMWLF
jgi:hypothetical protein